MLIRCLLLPALAIILNIAEAGARTAEACKTTPQRHAQFLTGEVSGKNTFSQAISDDWTVKLLPAPYGWDLRVVDKNGLDLSQITPPFRLSPNAREIYGWHFRNGANTGVNTGDVNAPQHTRLFFFSPALTRTGGFKPSSTNAAPDDSAGRGVFNILKMGLSDLGQGQKAQINYLKFNACLTWPKTVKDATNPGYNDADRQIIYGCGLDYRKYALNAWVLPRILEGDVDGDGSLDYIAPIIRKSDGSHGLAICRAGTWMSVFGYDHDEQRAMKTKKGEPRTETYFSLAQYLARTETWKMRRNNKARDEIVLGRIEKAEVAFRWQAKKFTHELLWVFVEQ